jgi:hypothetical protein
MNAIILGLPTKAPPVATMTSKPARARSDYISSGITSGLNDDLFGGQFAVVLRKLSVALIDTNAHPP